jgi:hypothetical protein
MHVQIRSTGPTTGSLAIDGEDFSRHVTDLQVKWPAGELPEVVVTLTKIDLDFDAEVDVQQVTVHEVREVRDGVESE